jgi:hypothetical protein
MPILDGDIKIVASQVLADVPEGGGAATAIEIVDGASNNVFPDVSDLDRIHGRLALSKVFLKIDTANVETYLGAHVIVSAPPADPDVSAVLFSTRDYFDRRTAAASRVQSYLATGPIAPALLFGNHLAGQMTVTLLQRLNVPLPVPGDSLVLRKLEATTSEAEQFVRVTAVESMVREFEDDKGIFERRQVTLSISDALRADYPGFDALRFDGVPEYVGRSKVYDTVVADAARYYSIVPLAAAASLGAYNVDAQSIFIQLVPSAQIETPIADARINQQAVSPVAAGGQIVQTLTLVFTTASQLYIGGAVLPGSLTIVRSGITLIDRGGVLLVQASNTSVGAVDYDNGICSLSSNVFGTGGGSHVVTYTPAARPTIVTESLSIPVTEISQRLTYAITLDPIPARGSAQVSFRAQARWYELRDDGSGALRGGASSVGVGTVNFTTGTVSLTLGALPDVDSRVIVQWAPAAAAQTVTPRQTDVKPRLYFEFNMPGFVAIEPGSVTVAWNDGAARTAGDSAGGLTGAHSVGSINYAWGMIRFSPNALPAPGTAITLTATGAARRENEEVEAFVSAGATWTADLPSPVKPDSLSLSVYVTGPVRVFPGVDKTVEHKAFISDDGAGNLKVGAVTCGNVNYTTGHVVINKSIAGVPSIQPVFVRNEPGSHGSASYVRQRGTQVRTVTLTVLNGSFELDFGEGPAMQASYAGAASASINASVPMDKLRIEAALPPVSGIQYPATRSANSGYFRAPEIGNVAAGLSFQLGSHKYVAQPDGTLRRYGAAESVAPNGGEPAGSVVPASGSAEVTLWSAGESSAYSNWSAVQGMPITDAVVESVSLRTAVSPLRSGSFSVAGTWGQDSVVFSAAADSSGVISTGSPPVDDNTPGSRGIFALVNYESGVAEVRFGRRVTDTPAHRANPQIVDASSLGVPGVVLIQAEGVSADTLRYNASAYSYIPLDADILGIDPVRLPADGRVPIFRAGSVVVVHHTATTTPAVVSNGQVVNLGRVRLARVRVIGANGLTIFNGYATDLDAGTVTFNAVAGYSQPVRIEHRIEDAALISAAQITGRLQLTRPLTHNFPVGSYVSSALLLGDLVARMPLLFDQATWTGEWSDTLIGSAAGPSFDAINYPVAVRNDGAVTERWALVFTNSTSFQIFGEHLGVIGVGNIAGDVVPLNPAGGHPYFSINHLGFGSGWSAGNVIRLNTVGSTEPLWLARVVKQGVETVADDRFQILARGDVDA